MREPELRWFDPREIIRCPIQLRPVRVHSLPYMQLRDSIKKYGLLTPVTTRDGPQSVEVCLGGHRHQAHLDLRLDRIPAYHRQMDDKEVRRAQVEENATRIETEPMEYAHRLYKMVEIEKSLTLDELAHDLNKTPDWVRRHLSLVRLIPAIKEATANNLVPIYVAVELAKLPPKLQEHYFGLYGRMPNTELRELIQQEARNLRLGCKEARLTDKLLSIQDSEPNLRSYNKIREERENPVMAAMVLRAAGAKTPLEIWQTALDWATNYDPLTLAELATRKETRRKKE